MCIDIPFSIAYICRTLKVRHLNNKDLIEKFKSIGFKEYEAKIFLVLLKGYPISASEIATEAGLVRTSIYDSLKSFVDKGYCNEIETGTVLKYMIIDPDVLTDKIEKDFNRLNSDRITSLKEIFRESSEFCGYGKNNSPDKEENVELIRGYNKHRVAKYAKLVESARNEILGMNRIRGVVTPELIESASILIKNGGSVKYIYKISLDFKIRKEGKLVNATKGDLVNLCETFISNGEEVRLTEMEIPNAAIFDGNIAFINIASNSSSASSKQSDLIIKNSDFVNNLKDMFLYYWNNSMTLENFKNNFKI